MDEFFHKNLKPVWLLSNFVLFFFYLLVYKGSNKKYKEQNLKDLQLRLGFLGTGTITNAVIRGICKSDLKVNSIIISSRNAQIARKLSHDFSNVEIAKNNQEIVSRSNLLFVALRTQIAEQILKSLIFHKGQKIVTFVPTTTCAILSGWVDNVVPVLRAVPLPFVAEHKSATPIFPADADLRKIFAKTGGVIEARNEHQFNLFMIASSLMGIYFHFSGLCDEWMQDRGLAPKQSSLYLATLFLTLSDEFAKQIPIDFKALEQKYSTKGGTNELIISAFEEKNGGKALKSALDEAFYYITKKADVDL
ncbi:MAG: pyrroline-5-carboxylate reductase [Candidatus Tokpelaia sp. JSC188]|nr:MAG: pyrroline-5-carboxylate reductase [Candidatus Tokpelaia sp. JSC188]